MFIKKPLFLGLLRYVQPLFWAVVLCIIFLEPAKADIVDAYNLAPFVPIVLKSMMQIATSLYDFFVGNGTGIIYICIYFFVGFSIAMYLIKMHFPKDWLGLFGFSEGGEMWAEKIEPWKITENVLKPCLRAVIAALFLLQIKPTFVTEWLVNPFLKFGSIYTEQVFKVINKSTINNLDKDAPVCPESISETGWISESSCNFLVRPVDIIAKENNKVIKYAFGFIKSGFRQLLTIFPHGTEGILNLITGILLLIAFVSSNLFMSLLIIQAIFDFCLSLIMYPFNVLTWVIKKSDKWFDVLPAFDQIIEALKNLIITMIACAFILCVNVALVRALFNWSSSVFVVSAGGMATSNVPTITNTAMNFGDHSILWLSALLTFFLMKSIFDLTQEKLKLYTKGTKNTLYEDVTKDSENIWKKIKAAPEKIKTIWNAGAKIKGDK